MYLSTSTSTEDFLEMYLSTFQVLYKLYLSTDVLKYKVLLPGSANRCKNLALYIRDCVSLCLSDETLQAVGPFYLVSMPGEVKDPTSLHWKCVTSRGLHILA